MTLSSNTTGKFVSLISNEVWEDIETHLRHTLSISKTVEKFSYLNVTQGMLYFRNSRDWKINLRKAQKGTRLQRNRKFSDSEERDFVRLYKKGFSTVEIAKKYSCHPSTICHIITKYHSVILRDASASKFGKVLSGKNHPQYIDGRCKTYPNGYRFEAEYNQWRKAVYKRDNYTCQICGVRPSKENKVVLNADHILPQSIFPEFRYVLENGRTLCHPCHAKTDTYGNKVKRLTRQDFDMSIAGDFLSGANQGGE